MRVGEAGRQYIQALQADGAVAVKPEALPSDWEQMSEQERQQYMLRRYKENEAGITPTGPVRNAPAASAGAAESDTFDPDAPDAILTGRAERYRMPNGKWVWVHPCSVEEATVINARTLRMTAERHGLGDLTDKRWNSPEMSADRTLRGQAMQVIHCCRRGKEATSAPIFDPLKHVEWLMREPGYLEAIQEICALSDRLSNGQGEAEALKEAMIGFFQRAQQWAETWHGLLSTDSGPTSLPDFCANLEDFAASASCMKQPEALSPEAWFAWQIILRDAPASEIAPEG